MSDALDMALKECNAERSLRPLDRFRPFSDEDWDRIVSTIAVNGGRTRKEETAENHMHLAKFLVAFRAVKGRKRGKLETRKALNRVLPDYCNCPDGTILNCDEDGRAWRIVTTGWQVVSDLADSIQNDTNAIRIDPVG